MYTKSRMHTVYVYRESVKLFNLLKAFDSLLVLQEQIERISFQSTITIFVEDNLFIVVIIKYFYILFLCL